MTARRSVKDYSEDDSTHTLRIIQDVTDKGCIVEEREYTYLDDDDTLCDGLSITLETLSVDDQVTRSLEELRDVTEGEVEFDI